MRPKKPAKKGAVSIDAAQLKMMNALSKQVLNEVIRRESSRVVQQEAHRIGKALVASQRKKLVAHIEKLAQAALRRRLRLMKKNLEVEIFFN